MQTNNAPSPLIDQLAHRDVTSTARLFNFRRPVFISEDVWDDCVEMTSSQGKRTDELAVLQRLRHVLFMAATSLYGRLEDLEYDFRIYRIPNTHASGLRKPEAVILSLIAHKDDMGRPVITIRFPDD